MNVIQVTVGGWGAYWTVKFFFGDQHEELYIQSYEPKRKWLGRFFFVFASRCSRSVSPDHLKKRRSTYMWTICVKCKRGGATKPSQITGGVVFYQMPWNTVL